MLIKYMKNASFLAVFAVCVFGVFISCNNPFSGNLGEKVDVEPPTITVESPAAGAYIQGTAQFTGKATAYRKLNSVKIRTEIRIIENDISKIAWTEWEDITHNNMGNMSGSDKDKTWTYNLDTSGREDGFLKIQFRASDPNLTAESVELVYIIKNSPSAVKLSVPDQNKLDSGEETVRIGTNTEIKGNIIDRRGVKPGYPMIKLWPAAMAEPAGGDPEWGWVSAFISGTDSTPEEGAWAYADRGALPVARAANFTFKLSKYAIDPATRQAVYDLSGGDYLPLDTGLYNFRVITSDSYFYTLEEANADPSATYMHPRGPVAAMGEHGETVGYMPGLDGPVTDPWDGGPFYTVQMVSAGVRPSVELDNSDIGRAELERTPNIYITENTAKKIVAEGPGRADFRLRILAAHPDLIEKATLEWEHAGAAHRSGFLPWDDLAGSDGYVDAGDPAGGHRGLWNNPAKQAEGKLFQFTADCGSLRDGGGNLVFTSSTEPYALKATVYSASGMQTAQKYTLYLDGSGPSVGIRSVRGAASAPAADGYAASGGVINENPYTVNGNIQVSVDRAASMGIAERADGLPAVKWVVEEDRAGYLEAEDTVYGKLRAFRRDPSAAGLEFFDGIGESPSSGWVSLPDRGGAAEADRTHNFTFNTFNGNGQGANQWDGKDLWLYVIAQDGIQNLGFAAQKLSVADGSDVPGLQVPGLVSNTEIKDGIQYDSKGKLYIGLTGGLLPSRAKTNVLDRDQGIDLGLNDDDALGDTEIVLKDLNGAAVAEISLGIAAGAREWNGVLTQQMMAAALYAGQEPLPQHLRDGMYELYIRVEDDMAAKVRIGRSPPREGDEPKLAWAEKRFYFAVHSQQPQIVIDSPAENSMQTGLPVDIYGKVLSRSRIQRLEVTFTPELIPGGYNKTSDPVILDLYADEARTGEYKIADPLGAQDAELDLADGVYTYYWKVDGQVNFDPPDLFQGATDAQKFDSRRFNLRTWDGMGDVGVSSCSVQVDTTPPSVELIEFNYGRFTDLNGIYQVNGKVPVIINAADLNGIKKDGSGPDDFVAVKWWVRPAAAAAPLWDTAFPQGATPAGTGNYFANADDSGGGNYHAVFNSLALTDGASYKLYAMAQDNAGNLTEALLLREFSVDQAGDTPALMEITPAENVTVGSGTAAIEGRAYDDDGFDITKLTSYVQIRWPSVIDDEPDPANDTGWVSWTNVTSAVLDSPEEISFTFNFSNTIYFASEGTKRYQVRVIDEKENKNPLPNPVNNPVEIVEISEAVWTSGVYSFVIKTKPPQVFFSRYDPNPLHHGYESTQNIQRPAYGEKSDLFDALTNSFTNNAGKELTSHVEEAFLSSLEFIYNGGIGEGGSGIIAPIQKNIPFTAGLSQHPLTLDSDGTDWLASFDSLPEGMHSVAVRAMDSLGNLANVEWSFFKDKSGPEINFTSPTVISGSNLFVRGTFYDSYSQIANSFRYRIINKETNNVFRDSTMPIPTHSQSCNWAVPIPSGDDNPFYNPEFPDGAYLIEVTVKDMTGLSSTGTFDFILDRASPIVSEQGSMMIAIEQHVLYQPLEEHERIFSAAYAADGDAERVFSLSGLVYEHNLTQLNAVISTANITDGSVTMTLDGIGAWASAYSHDNNTATDGTNNSNFRIRAATAAEIGIGTGQYLNIKPDGSPSGMENLYIWELDISKGDLHALMQQSDSQGVYRQVALTAGDISQKNSQRKNWRFRLDNDPPDISEFLNINTAAPHSVFAGDDFNLQGVATDDINVKEIQYRLAKWDYPAGAFRYWNNVTKAWDIDPAAATEAQKTWHYIHDPADTAYSVKNTVYWKLDSAALEKSAFYPSDLFKRNTDHEGRYRLDLRATDWSFAAADSGNPVSTIDDDTGVSTGPEFFIDRADPVINWTSTPRDFYKYDNDGVLTFSFEATDPNTVKDITPKLLKGGVAAPGVTVSHNFTGTTESTTGNVTVTLTWGSVSDSNNGRYVLDLEVTDAAGNTASVNNTVDFYLDNIKPAITIDPAGGNAAIAGRVMLRGKFEKQNPNSSVSRVAFYVGTTPPAVDINNLHTDWRYYDGTVGSTRHQLIANGKVLMEINDGLATANILIPDTRNYTASYLGNVENAPDGVTFNDGSNAVSITGNDVRKLTVHFLAIDQAGNSNVTNREYWVYPEGDKPEVVEIHSPDRNKVEAERMMNGRIRISGEASDNVRVKSVWFRVINLEPGAEQNKPFINLRIPKWDSFWGSGDGYQEPVVINNTSSGGTNYGNGWYLANGGGKARVAWWAFVNTEGELDPGNSTSRRIRIEVMAEDTIWNDSTNGGLGSYEGTYDKPYPNSMYSNLMDVTAFVVNGAPRFDDEYVLNAASKTTEDPAGNLDFSKWGSVQETSVRGRAAYSITVKHDTGIGEILWNRADSVINLLGGNPASDDYINSTYGLHLDRMDSNMDYNEDDNPGIAVKAGPRALISGPITEITELSGKERTFMIWKPAGSAEDISITVQDGGTTRTLTKAETEARYTIFTLQKGTYSYGIGSMQLMEMTDEGTFEWVIVADINTGIIPYNGNELNESGDIGENWGQISDRFPINFSARETSKLVPLKADYTAGIPVDNLKPRIQYSHNTNVAGSASTFGGVAGDTGLVGGLSRVVLWFSREKKDANGLVISHDSIVWNDRVNSEAFKSTDDVPAGIALPAGIDMPLEPDEHAAPGNFSCIVIDRHDPRGNNAHHGHQLRMGFADVGGALGRAWYVVLDSNDMLSAQVTAHYVVYDQAGNAAYGSQKLMIMNGIPRISKVTLATEIRKDTGLHTALGAGTGNLSVSNTGINGKSVLGVIRNVFRTKVPGFGSLTENAVNTPTTMDSAMGISREIGIDTKKLNNYAVVYDQPDFTVRNNLFALRVETDSSTESSGKPRNYRVEYVSGARPLPDQSAITAANGIRAGRVYIIDNPGTGANRFPWGSLGAQGETYRQGLAFLALENASELKIPEGVTYQDISVWELNSDPSGTHTVPAPHKLVDVEYSDDDDSTFAEFVYRENAFGNDASHIRDFTPNLNDLGRPVAYPSNTSQPPWEANSLFIIRVFAGVEPELFGDFALLSVRVNNNDVTPPYAQLYDLNPKTEGVDNERTLPAALDPVGMGQNRTLGGLYNTEESTANIEKSGHIEPRRNTSLNSSQMGGAQSSPGTIERPFADPASAAFFTVDTVSGEVIVRGYAEDDQRIGRVDLEFWNEANTARIGSPVTILRRDNTPSAENPEDGKFPTGPSFLQSAAGNRVNHIETLELNRHRVEWAYLWNSESVPGGSNVVGNINIRAVAYNTNSDLNANLDEGEENTPITANTKHTSTRIPRIDSPFTRTYFDTFNLDFPASSGNFYRYNDIRVNIRPYITGFRRNQDAFSHNTRSRQGWYMFYRGESVVVAGFNLSNDTGDTVITLPGAAGTGITTNAVGSANIGTVANNDQILAANQERAFALNSTNPRNYRLFTVPAASATGNGMVTLTVNGYEAVNTSASNTGAASNGEGRWTRLTAIPATARPGAILPWNVERNPGIEGSDLWDDFTQVHIWRSDSTNSGDDRGHFQNGNFNITYPAMSINPLTGVLWESHNEGGGGSAANTGTTKISNNSGSGATTVTQFVDPIRHSDIHVNASGEQFAVSSIIGRYGGGTTAEYNRWHNLGGIYIWGPGGLNIGPNSNTTNNTANPNLQSGITFTGTTNSISLANTGLYLGESTWYNASFQGPNANNNTLPYPPYTDQFHNPHIVTSGNNIHISYYDEKDGSIKYKYNERGVGETYLSGNRRVTPTYSTTAATYYTNANSMPRNWINLDGGFDREDDNVIEVSAIETRTLTTASGVTNLPNRYVRQVHVANNSSVIRGQLIYTIGPADLNSMLNITEIKAHRAGTISLNYPTPGYTSQQYANRTWGANNSNVTWNTGTTTANRNTRLYEVCFKDGDFVNVGELIYRFGTNTNNNVIRITARKSGIISGLQFTAIATAPLGSGVTPDVSYTIQDTTHNYSTFFENNTNSTNNNNEFGAKNSNVDWNINGSTANRITRLWTLGANNGDFVNEGDEIYVFGTNANSRLIVINAQKSGIISGLQFTAIATAPLGSGVTPNVSYTISYECTTSIQNMSDTVYSITYTYYDISGTPTRVVGGATRTLINAGEHNAIAVTSQGYPVVAYFDATNQKLKMAVSNSSAPTAAANWKIIDNVIPSGNRSHAGTGQFVSIQIDTKGVTGETPNQVHIAALNSVNKQLVYITGKLSSTGDWSETKVQVVDSVGNVGSWCNISLDKDGNPWIAYQDESWRGSRDGVKLAYKNTATFYKGTADTIADRDRDLYGASITGWEAMHVPTQFRVENARFGMECFPTRNVDPNSGTTKTWKGAVGYLGEDRFRLAYYME